MIFILGIIGFNVYIYLIIDKIIVILPNEIDYYHNIVAQHNQTISNIENKLEIILGDPTIKQILNIINNINSITQQINVTLIQNDLTTIANDLNKVIH